MGGYGSTRWGNKSTKEDTDSALRLSIRGFLPNILQITSGNSRPLFINSTWSRGGHKTAAIGIWLFLRDDIPIVRLEYTSTPAGGVPVEHSYIIGLEATAQHFGGVRWWWLCPTCGRRCGVLYMAGSQLRFSCWRCQGLSYTSSQESTRYNLLDVALGAQSGRSPAEERRLFKSMIHWRVMGELREARLAGRRQRSAVRRQLAAR